jgi:hypothetical protein
MREVQLVMFGLILVAVVRARDEFLADRPLTWLMGAGFLVLLAASLASVALGSRPAARGRPTMRPRAD